MKTQTTITSYHDLLVWQKSKAVSIPIYTATKNFPSEEKYGLSSQMHRAAVSIPSNIAEGRARRSRKDFVQFLQIASGSVAELETQCDIAQELGYVDEMTYNKIVVALAEVGRMLSGTVAKLEAGS